MSCNFTSRLELLPFERDSSANLTSLIEGCDDVCLLVYGTGNPDLAGIGVIISYIFQLGLAILFGPIISMDIFLFSVFRRARSISHFVGWLNQHHEMCLWSQLLFAMAISLACFVRQLQESCSIYEMSIIRNLAGLNVTSFLLTLSAYHFPIQRMVIFGPSTAIIYIFTGLAEYLHLVRRVPFGRILQTCRDIAEHRNVPWRKDLVPPYLNSAIFPPLFSFTGLIIALTGLWLYLWLRRGRWLETFAETRHQNGGRFRSRTRAAPLQVDDYSKVEWVVGVCIILISVTLAGMTISLLDIIMRERRAMILISNGKTGENLWGVGQIGALFAWAPLLVEMGYNGVYCRKA